jgi:hypothetical protein
MAFKMDNHGPVLAALKPVLNIVDANGLVMEGRGFNNIHNNVKIMAYEGHEKYYQFVTQLQAIKEELRELCYESGRELHGISTPSSLPLVVIWRFGVGPLGMLGQHLLSFAEIKIEIVYNMYRVKPVAVSRPPCTCR